MRNNQPVLVPGAEGTSRLFWSGAQVSELGQQQVYIASQAFQPSPAVEVRLIQRGHLQSLSELLLGRYTRKFNVVVDNFKVDITGVQWRCHSDRSIDSHGEMPPTVHIPMCDNQSCIHNINKLRGIFARYDCVVEDDMQIKKCLKDLASGGQLGLPKRLPEKKAHSNSILAIASRGVGTVGNYPGVLLLWGTIQGCWHCGELSRGVGTVGNYPGVLLLWGTIQGCYYCGELSRGVITVGNYPGVLALWGTIQGCWHCGELSRGVITVGNYPGVLLLWGTIPGCWHCGELSRGVGTVGNYPGVLLLWGIYEKFKLVNSK
ncbi:hypothetical protein Btru_064657 [Bulinus truncatus]|nr:hypothetical protein Btru_064657 [Bulinus truncatus]